MTPKDILLHLRLPFSIFLMPIFWFAISQLPNVDTTLATWIFIIWHIFIYPASNAYNSYFDKDEGSIGGLEKPPSVDIRLYYVALIMDILAVVLSLLFVSKTFALAVFVYGIVSKMYSHTSVRLKKYPILSWLVVGFFQGCFVYMSTQQAITNEINFASLYPGLLSSMMLWAIYPITQIYQHDEDSKRGDTTMSIVLGIKGTFYFAGILYTLATLGFFFYLPNFHFLLFLILTSPTIVFFVWWFLQVYKDIQKANFKNTMLLNVFSSIGLNILFFALFLLNHKP